MIYRLSGVTKTFGSRTVVNIPDLKIEAGRIYALLGPNGAGKTTLLNILGFLDLPSSGRLFYRSREVDFAESSLQALRREVVMLDQHPILFSTTVYKNLEFGLKIRGILKNERERIIHENLEMVGMQDFAGAAAHRLSGGETQRVALARALALSPRVFLCDEPTSNVDVENQSIILKILRQINESRLISIIFTTHDRSLASRLAHRVLALDHGSLVPDVYENVFSGRWITDSQDCARFALGQSLSMAVTPTHANRKRQTGRMFIDSTKISLHMTGDAEGETQNEFSGRVVRLSEEGSSVWVVVDIGVDLTVLLPASDYAREPLRIGQKLHVAIPTEAIEIVG